MLLSSCPPKGVTWSRPQKKKKVKDLKPAGEVEGQAGDIGRLDLGDQLDVVHEAFLVH
jgi:hypothetical protein